VKHLLALGFTHKLKTSLEKLAADKHSNVFEKFANDGPVKTLTQSVIIIKKIVFRY